MQVESVNGRIILAGSVPNLQGADRVVQLARTYAKDDASVLNMMSIDGKDQVTLKVRVVEMQRSVIKQMGINLSGSIGFGQLTGNAFDNTLSIGASNAFPIAGTALGGLVANLGYKNSVGAAQRRARWARKSTRWSASVSFARLPNRTSRRSRAKPASSLSAANSRCRWRRTTARSRSSSSLTAWASAIRLW